MKQVSIPCHCVKLVPGFVECCGSSLLAVSLRILRHLGDSADSRWLKRERNGRRRENERLLWKVVKVL